MRARPTLRVGSLASVFPADGALPDPVIVLIDDESSALSDEQIANETAELLASLASGPVIDLDDLDIAELIRQDRADRGA